MQDNSDDGPSFANYSENSYHVVKGSGTDTTAILGGFTITSGSANGSVAFLDDSGGGMYSLNGSPILIDNTFSDNLAVRGGGMFNYSSNPILINCTFSGNFAAFYGGGMFNSGSNPTITNSIFWLNTDSGGANESAQVFGGTPIVNYSCIQGWTGLLGGTGNIGDDPMFVRNPDDGGDGWGVGGNDDFGDLRLSSGSPCIDAGDNTAVPPDIGDIDGDSNTTERTPLDLDGINRFIDGPLTVDTGLPDLPDYPFIVDMGAYEYHP